MARQPAEVANIVAKTVEALRQHGVPIRSAYLFGSYVVGKPGEDSDIDIAVFSDAVDNMSLNERLSLLARVEMEVGVEVEIHLFASRCLEEARPTNFYGHILKTGRRIA